MSRTLRVWEYLGRITESYHDGGALLIISDDAQATWLAYRAAQDRGENLLETLPEPDHTHALAEGAPEIVLVFPDGGCC